LTKTLATGQSRRRVLGGLGAGLAALVAGRSASAKPHPKNCKDFCAAAGLRGAALGRCQHDCAQGGQTGLYHDCAGDLANLCQTANGPVCRDLTSDPSNCGACGAVCSGAQSACVAGACACPAATPTYCPASQTCVNTQTDPNHCGGCAACPSPYDVCVNGVCQPLDCGGNGDPLRACHDANGPFCCGEGEFCQGTQCLPCISGNMTYCMTDGTCPNDGPASDDVPCGDGEGRCTVQCEYYQAPYVCEANDGGTLALKMGCCTPEVDCPNCVTGTGDDAGFAGCPPATVFITCGSPTICRPPSSPAV
jgi:hypothetical protein